MKGKKLKKVSMDNERPEINKIFSSLSICLKPETDFPHPRHLCFTYHFGNSSPQRYCCKVVYYLLLLIISTSKLVELFTIVFLLCMQCYCYVCEEVAPFKMWWNPLQTHCEATNKDYKWRLERQLNNILPQPTTMVCHTSNIFFLFLFVCMV